MTSYIAPGYRKKNWCGTCRNLITVKRRITDSKGEEFEIEDVECKIKPEEKKIVWEYFWVEGPKNRNRDRRIDSCDCWTKKI